MLVTALAQTDNKAADIAKALENNTLKIEVTKSGLMNEKEFIRL